MKSDQSDQFPEQESIQKGYNRRKGLMELSSEQIQARFIGSLKVAHAMPPKEQKDVKRGKPVARRKPTTNNIKKPV
jgi:hypothetical protein